MAKKQFKAESKRLLDLMVNSIYTHHEIFLREIVSNASDACDKLAYRALTDDAVKVKRKDLEIRISVDKAARTITVSDNGVGMSRQELEDNLGVIAASDSFRFKQEAEDKKTDVIGQFGVGFYSAFMVCDRVTVISRKYDSAEAWRWESSGADGYTVTECEKDGCGTDVIMHLKDDTETETYGQYLDEWKIEELVRKYSDYIRFPIRMALSETRRKEGSSDDKPEYETVREVKTLNSMVPLWQRRRASVKDEEYFKFYRDKFHEYSQPQRIITVS
ncbi:MAG: ATP-binding protein, partial [Oscillibacter sp.]|nr:ATP-binding protein [Oscillibacter sp.]